MKNTFRKMCCLLIFLFIAGCEVNDNGGNTLSTIDSKINFIVKESHDYYLSSSEPEIYLNLATEKIYGCCNFPIIADCNIKGNIITVNLSGINKSGICLTALGPATANLKLGQIEGDYILIIRSSYFSDNYNLSVNSSNINVSGAETNNTKPAKRNYQRYPENSMVYYCGTLTENSYLCQDFIDTLKTVIDITEFTFPENGEIPYGPAGGGHYYDAEPRYFYYQNDADFFAIEDVLKKFKSDYFPDNNGTGLNFLNWKNEQVMSWTL